MLTRYLQAAVVAWLCMAGMPLAAGVLPTICPTISVTPSAALGNGALQVPYAQAFAASGSVNTPYVFTLTSGAVPGLTLDSGGNLSGTPTQDGNYLPTITATDTVGCSGGRTYALNVLPAVLTTSPGDGAVNVAPDSAITIDFTEPVDAGASAFTLQCPGGSAIPFGVAPALPSSAASYTLTPGASLPAATTCVVVAVAAQIASTANPTLHPAADYSFSFTTGQPPAITSASSTTFTVGQAGATFTVQATGTPTPSLTIGGTLLPGNLLFQDNGDGTGTLSGTPAVATGGQYAITFKATNSIGSSPVQNFTLTVNEAPAITSANATSFPIGQAGSFSVIATGYPGPTFSKTGTLPNNVTLGANGLLGGTPQAGTAGSYPITVTATNGVGSDAQQSFTLSVTCPVITVGGSLPDGLYQNAYGPQQFTQGGGAGSISWSATGLPAGLGIDSSSGALSGTPTDTVAGATVVITATDAFSCQGTKTFNNFNVRPVAADDTYTTVGNTPLYLGVAAPSTPAVVIAGAVTGNDSGPVSLTPTVSASPAQGAVTFNNDGTFIYTPAAGSTTSDSFSYYVTDGNGVQSAPATVTVNISGKVWYVNGGGGAGDGRAATPFNSLAGASSAHAAGDTIFVEGGASAVTTPGAITLKANSTLWGQGTALPAFGAITITNTGARAAKPKLTGTVTLGGNNTTVSSLDISTASATGLTNSGTISGVTVKNAVTVATTTGTAVALSNASGTLGFRSISSNGASNGINLANVGGSFSISGDGTAAANGSGGSIASSVAQGILYSGGGATLNLQQINVTNSGSGSSGAAGNTGSGIQVTGAGGFTLNRANVTDTAGGGFDEGVFLSNSSGALAITNSAVTGAPHNAVRIDNTSINIGSLTLTGNTIGSITNNGSTTFGNDGVLLTVQGTTSVASATIQSNTFSNVYATALQAQAGGSASISNMQIGGPGAGNTFSGNNLGIDLDQDNSAALTFSILNNSFNNHHSHALNVFSTSTSTGGSVTGKIDGNTIGTTGTFDSGSAIGDGIRLNINGQAHGVLTVSNNVVNEVPTARGIDLVGRLGTGGANFKVANNTVTRPTGTNQSVCGAGTPCPLGSIYISSAPITAPNNTVCAVVSGNTAYDPTSWALGGEAAYFLQNVTGATFKLEGTLATASTQISTTNTVTSSTFAPVTTLGTIAIVAPGTCGLFP